MDAEIREFWNQVRDELRPVCGQIDHKRDRRKFENRKRLAEELKINDKTLKGFMNGSQKGLGAVVLPKLLELYPNLRENYQWIATLKERQLNLFP
jgi:hypothetical protein